MVCAFLLGLSRSQILFSPSTLSIITHSFNQTMSSPKFLSSKFGHVIDGEISVIPSGAKMMNVINPATEESIAEVPIATKKELDQAVDAAHKAQKEWGKKSFAERGEIISKWGKAYEETMEDLVELLIAEQGKSRMVVSINVVNAGEVYGMRVRLVLEENLEKKLDICLPRP